MMNGKPLVIDGYCGLGGWTAGFQAEGWECVGIDIERHDYGNGSYPGHLILQDMLTVNGAQFKDADCLVFSPPCQRYSYMAMPWTRAKALIVWHKESPERVKELNALFDACFRIQIEASKAAGHYIPMVVENVKGAQPWVGRAKTHYGSFYLWGDVPALMPFTNRTKVVALPPINSHAEDRRGRKNDGGSWFNVAHNTERGLANNPVSIPAGQKLPKGNCSPRRWEDREIQRLCDVPRKGTGGSWFTPTEAGRTVEGHWRDSACVTRQFSSKSNARKAASAQIAMIPLPLSRWIARCFKP